MRISVSSTLTVYHDGQFWIGPAEHVEDGRYGVACIVFGAEPSDEEIMRFVVGKWEGSWREQGYVPCSHACIPHPRWATYSTISERPSQRGLAAG